MAKTTTKADLEKQVKGLEGAKAGLKADLKAAEEKIAVLETTTVPKETLKAEGILDKIRWFLEDKATYVKLFVTMITIVIPMVATGWSIGDVIAQIQNSQDFVNELYGIIIGALGGTALSATAMKSPKK